MSLLELQCKDNITIEMLEKHEALFAFLCFKNFEEYFPLLSRSNRSFILNYLISKPMISKLDEIKILDYEVTLPEDMAILSCLKKLTIDDYNINKFFGNWEYFSTVEDLTIFTSVDIMFDFGKFKRLTLANTGKEMRSIPEITSNGLEYLHLSGFSVRFKGKLPKTLILEDCYVDRSSNLEGCESMTLICTFWENPSVPSKELILHETNFGQEISNMEVLHLSKSSFNTNISEIVNLKEFKYIGLSDPRYEDLPPTIDKLIYCFFPPIKGNTWSHGIREMILKDVNDSMFFPNSLERLTLSNSKISCDNFKPAKKLLFLKIAYSEIIGHTFDCSSSNTILTNVNFRSMCYVMNFGKICLFECNNVEGMSQFRFNLFDMTKKDFILLCSNTNNLSIIRDDLYLLRNYDETKWKTFVKILEVSS